MLYNIIVGILRIIYKIIFRFKVHNKPVDLEGPIILCSNHSSYNDPIALAVAVDRTLNFMAKAELFKNPILSTLIKELNAFPINRKTNDVKALKQSMKILKNNEILVIFPEGTRTNNPSLDKMNKGVGTLAHKMGARILPAYIDWDKKIFSTMDVYFRAYIDPKTYKEEGKELDLAITKDLYESIYGLKGEDHED